VSGSIVNIDAVRKLFPETWTHVHNLDWLRIGFGLKLHGVEWRSLPEALTRCELAGIVQRDGYTIRRKPC